MISGSAEFSDAAREAAAAIHQGIKVHSCGLLAAANVAATVRPAAIVMDAAVFAFDPVEIRALARDVGAHLVVVDSEALGDKERVGAIRSQLDEAFTA